MVKILGCLDTDIGGKARNLIWLERAGARVPPTWVLCHPASLTEITLSGISFAVRSSSPDEDRLEKAHAGEFSTLLDVDPDRIPEAVSEVQESTGDGSAVVVQTMVKPVVSGVVFSRDPVTGLSDVVVEAIRGRGDELLSGGAEALRWISRNGSLVEYPKATADLEDVVSRVVVGAKRLERRYGRPVDIEWVWDGDVVWWVQIRPITAIEDVPIYSRRISRDVMPGMIKPLVWSVNVPMVNTAWLRLITEAIGPNQIEPESLAASHAYRSYFDMRVFGDIFEKLGMPRDSLEKLLGLPGARGRMRPGVSSLTRLPRLLALAWRLRLGTNAMAMRRAQLQERFLEMSRAPISDLSDSGMVEHLREVQSLGVEAAYLNIVIPLQANLYAGWLRKRLQSWAERELEDLGPPPKGEWDFTRELHRLRESLSQLPSGDLRLALDGEVGRLDVSARSALDEFLSRFGHLGESVNDMSVPRWREEPASVLRLALDTATASSEPTDTWADVERSLSWIRRARLRRLRSRAEALMVMREAVGSTFTFGYGLLRPGFLELGSRLSQRGSIEKPEDVFFVTQQRAIDALLNRTDQARFHGDVERVKREMDEVADVLMPDTIVGDHWIPVSGRVTDRLEGVGASRGRYRGRARFLQSISEARSLKPGEVLILERSDVAWTPVFVRAGAIVTEAGGLLAHSSITAREMGLPCVASVAGARRLHGSVVLVDGSSGEVFVES